VYKIHLNHCDMCCSIAELCSIFKLLATLVYKQLSLFSKYKEKRGLEDTSSKKGSLGDESKWQKEKTNTNENLNG